jgi:hypothetical protein
MALSKVEGLRYPHSSSLGRMKFHGQRRKAQGSRIKDKEGALGFSLVPFALRPVPDFYASFLGISSRSKACGMDIFHQPLKSPFSTVS